MKRSFIIKDAFDDMPPNEGEGAMHILLRRYKNGRIYEGTFKKS